MLPTVVFHSSLPLAASTATVLPSRVLKNTLPSANTAPRFTTSQQANAFRSLLEGDAVRIENEYIGSLPAADKQTYQDSHNKEVDNAVAGLNNVPIALQALQSAPYLVGPPFDELLVASGTQERLDQAFENPPTTGEQRPTAPETLQASHWPSQAPLQQTPSTQWAVPH